MYFWMKNVFFVIAGFTHRGVPGKKHFFEEPAGSSYGCVVCSNVVALQSHLSKNRGQIGSVDCLLEKN